MGKSSGQINSVVSLLLAAQLLLTLRDREKTALYSCYNISDYIRNHKQKVQCVTADKLLWCKINKTLAVIGK